MPKAGSRNEGKGPSVLRNFLGRIKHLNFRRFEECRTVLSWLEPRAGEDILDVGCGDGYYTGLIAGTGARVVGIDIIPGRPARRSRDAGTGGPELLTMDAEEMDFPPASFDKVVSFCVIEHLNRDDIVFERIARVLKPGGLIVFSADSLSNPGITEADLERHRRRYYVKSFYTLPKVKEKLSAAGLEVEDAHYVLTTRLASALARVSWKLDLLPAGLAPAKWLGYLAVSIAAASLRRNSLTDGSAAHGLTLLVRARKPAGPSGRVQLPI